jgi:DNA (cytosine-5)-methyltransferase 1
LPIWKGVEIFDKKINTLVFDEKLLYLIGRWFGDGLIRIFENENRYEFIICCGKHELEELREKIEIYTTSYTLVEERTTYKFIISSKELCFYMKQFGKGALNKELTQDILDLPTNLLKVFLDGYLDADGHYDKITDKWSCCSISKKLIVGIQQCVAKVYKQSTTFYIKDNSKYSSIIEGRKVNTNMAFNISFYKNKRNQQHSFFENGYLWIPYRKKKLINKDLKVYNLSVDKDESYTVNNYICHNCSSFSISGNREKDWGKEKKFKEGQELQVLDTLFFDFIDLTKKLQPKVVIAENVKGLLMGNAKKYVEKIYKEFRLAGYDVQHYLLNSKTMGVPQSRERVFFIGIRKDISKKFMKRLGIFGSDIIDINLRFNEPEISFRTVRSTDKIENLTDIYIKYWNNSDEGGTVGKFGTYKKLKLDRPSYAIVSSNRHYDPLIRRTLNNDEIKKIQTFPLDYDFNGRDCNYVCGMSVPPVMIANIATRIYYQILNKL